MKKTHKKEKNERSWTTRPTKQQSTRMRRHDIVIESSGNVQVVENKILIIEGSKRI